MMQLVRPSVRVKVILLAFVVKPLKMVGIVKVLKGKRCLILLSVKI